MKKNTLLELYKFIFAVIILLFHSRYLYDGDYSFFRNGSIFVEPYFIIAGFLMASSACKDKSQNIGEATKRFIFKKINRVLIPTTISFFVGYLLLVIFTEYAPQNIIFAVFEIFYLDGVGIRIIRVNSAIWYISSMLISLYILYPIYLKNRDIFINIIGPLIMLFVLGYIFKEYGELRQPSEWTGLFVKGTLRGFALAIAGILIFEIYERLKDVKFKAIVKYFTILGRLGILFIIMCYAHWGKAGAFDFLCIVLFCILILSIFLNLGIELNSRTQKLMSFLGEYSFYIFISHFYLTTVLKTIFINYSYWQILPIYIFCTIINSIVIMKLTKLIQKNNISKVKRWFTQ